jgi:hypothetical protein
MLTIFSPYDTSGQAGFCHLSDRSTSLLDPRRHMGLWPNTPEGSEQRISVTDSEASGSDRLGTWHDGTCP